MARRLRVAVLLALIVASGGVLTIATPGDARKPGAGPAPKAKPVRGCRDKSLVPTPANLGRVRVATQCLINERRRSKRLRPLRTDAALRGAAQNFSNLMVRDHFFDHTGPDGSTLSGRIERTSYGRGSGTWSLGENINYDLGPNATPLLTVRRWMGSPQHRIHILQRRYRDIGIGVTFGSPLPEGGPGATYSAVFGGRG